MIVASTNYGGSCAIWRKARNLAEGNLRNCPRNRLKEFFAGFDFCLLTPGLCSRAALARCGAVWYTARMPRNGTTEERERLRLLAANMFDQGLPPAQIARIMEVDDQTVRRWRRAYRRHGREGLRGSKPPGARPKLAPAQKAELVGLLGHPPQEHGLDGWLWTSKLVAGLIQRRFGVKYHHDHVGVLLHELGLSWQRPARRAKERDEQGIVAWRQRVWPELLKKVPSPAAACSSSPMRSGS